MDQDRHDVQVLLVDSDESTNDEARSLALPSKRERILSHRVLRVFHLDGIGRFVALTPNDDVNTLAGAYLRRLFGNDQVFRARPSTNLGRPLPEYAGALQAPSFGAGVTLNELEALAKAGGVTRDVKLDGSQTMDSVRQRVGLDSAPLFVVTDESVVDFIDHDQPLPGSATLVLPTRP